MGDEIGEVGRVRQVAGSRGGGVEHDDHRAGLQLAFDAGGDLADMRVRNGQHHDIGAIKRLVGRDGVDAEIVLQALSAGLADLDVTDLVGRAAKLVASR